MIASESSEFIAKAKRIYKEEKKIDLEEDLYLITYAPDPNELPDAPFDMQHRYIVNGLAEFLRTCRCGALCLEATQLGCPHYHGWYQISEPNTLARVCWVKTLRRFGLLKVNKVGRKDSIKKHSWSSHYNCLYYYKKDLLDSQLGTYLNPITRDVKDKTNWNDALFLLYAHDRAINKNRAIMHVREAVSLRKEVMEFYK